MSETTTDKSSWSFSRAFWIANSVEVLERAAWYGVFVALTLYLSRVLGFNDVMGGTLSGVLTAGLYFLPTFSGVVADRIGFRNSLLLAFGLLTIGYAGMWVLPTMLEAAGLVSYGHEVVFTGLQDTGYKWLVGPIMLIVMVGGSFIKAVITGTVAKETTEATRARGYSIFYAMVNVGAFSGKTIVKPLRESMGDEGFVVLNLFAAAMTLLAFILVFLFYRSYAQDQEKETRSFADVGRSLIAVCSRGRLIALTIIIVGFWMVQHQLYASMPKYVLRMAGEGASPSWYANVNPAVVVLTVAWVTQLLRKKTALFSMTIGMFIMPLSAFCMAAGNMIDGQIFGWHPVAVMMIVGIAFQGLAESFISPRFLEYFSLQAPKGEEGLYLGFSHLHSFISALIGFVISGLMLDRWCPDPQKFVDTRPEVFAQWKAATEGVSAVPAELAHHVKVGADGLAAMPAAYDHAHYLWFVFVGIASLSAVSLIVYGRIVGRIDSKKA